MIIYGTEDPLGSLSSGVSVAYPRGGDYMQPIACYLMSEFEEIEPYGFYRDIFPEGELDEEGAFTEGKYVAIACDITTQKKTDPETGRARPVIKRYSVCDELDSLDYLIQSKSARTFMAPVSYAGKSRMGDNARFMYALVIEIDNLRTKKHKNGEIEQLGLKDLLFQIENKKHPRPTYIVSSGNGVHLYYVFDRPVPLYENVKKSIKAWKWEMTRRLWNKYVTDLWKEEDIQYESILQAFRVVGSLCKDKINRARAYKTGEKVSIEYLNSFTFEDNKIEEVYKNTYTLKEAKAKFPEWYERRVVQKEPRGRWVNKRDLYDWWIRKMHMGATVGHRYFCLQMLAIFAIKCNIPYEELEADAFSFLEEFDAMSTESTNPFREEDILSALNIYSYRDYVSYPRSSIEFLSGIEIPPNKRNGRKQMQHMEVMRAIQNITNPNWREGNGRKPKKDVVQEWRKNNPNGKKAQCVRETGLTKPTVYKWWDD